MKLVVIGAHLLRDDVEPVAEAIGVGDLYLSAVSVADDQPLGDRDLLVRIASVRGRLLEVATFVAIRYGLAVTSDEEALSRCSAHLQRWKRLLTAHRDHVEMTLKVAAASAVPRPDRRDFSDGASYLRALHASAQAVSVDPAFRSTAEQLFAPMAVASKWQHRDGRSVELVMLIGRERLDDVAKAGEALRRDAPHVPFLLSGPWPLEVFADDDLE